MKRIRHSTVVILLALIVAMCTPFTSASSMSKEELCTVDVDNSRDVLELLEVVPEPAPTHNERIKGMYPRILCFALSYSAQHQTRIRAVAETWGQRCDKLLFFSNMSDTIVVAANTSVERHYEVVQIDIIADHDHLWLRARVAMEYLHEHFRHDFDWFYRCDDDTYAIIENMRAYLKRPEILQRFNREPMQLGHRFNMPAEAVNHFVRNETLRSMWHLRWDRLVYNSGGSGYVMNRLFLDKIVESLPDWTCLPDEADSSDPSAIMPDDTGVSFCMMWHNIYPWDTRDHRGRERWHALAPENVFTPWDDSNNWYTRYHDSVGGVRSEYESAAPDSVAFHYVKPQLMYHLERSLYLCRTEHNDIATFNNKFGLAIGDEVMTIH
ncbi:Glycoprotein-N-acetylgalactosamine 3-beta-galactosyltransferase [Phytophthora megakarya]|uniref:N-acetylgalactosaminide beta-1,3-galactosyltransferase n=1 Tax=Phytophthora megakarya TaxID=4795 RepID=A0A225X200_9STRA|nr:Glycoprotein-N-acetylgalactosamine 3-beta-galactosyltransferase [Phytophthora megakarya]